MRRIAAALALALCLIGCDALASWGEPVELLTGVDGCWAGGETGLKGRLVVDQEYGTSFDGSPVMWPVGFTAVRLLGGEVAVSDDEGKVVATTGRDYYLSRAPVIADESRRLMERVGAFPVAANCGYLWDLVDCGPLAPPSPYCDAAASLRRPNDAR